MTQAAVATLLCAVFLVSVASGYRTLSVGDRILHQSGISYGGYPTNVSSALSSGWVFTPGCDHSRGYRANYQQAAPSPSYPVSLFFNAAGQAAGIGVTVYGQVKQHLIDLGFWEQVDDNEYFTGAWFRNSTDMCSGAVSPYPLGDRILINAGKKDWPIPLTDAEAIHNGWFNGSCFPGMGFHFSYDLADPFSMTWVAGNMLPVVAMYNKGEINAIFFATTAVQQSLLSPNGWDAIPLLNPLMCKNWCVSCSFSDTETWSTMHIWLRDPSLAVCPAGCGILACCPYN